MSLFSKIASHLRIAQDEAGFPMDDDALGIVLADTLREMGWRVTRLEDLPAKGHARGSDPSTSHDAGRSIDDMNERQRLVHKMLSAWPTGLTDEQVRDQFDRFGWPHQSQSSLRSRRAELVAAGLVRATGETRPTRSGRQAQVWEVCE
jgi:hypothetical protein